LRGTKQPYTIDSKHIEIASRIVPHGCNDEKSLFKAGSMNKILKSQLIILVDNP